MLDSSLLPEGDLPKPAGGESPVVAGGGACLSPVDLATDFLAASLVGNFADGPGGALGLEAAAGAAVEVAACDD